MNKDSKRQIAIPPQTLVKIQREQADESSPLFGLSLTASSQVLFNLGFGVLPNMKHGDGDSGTPNAAA